MDKETLFKDIRQGRVLLWVGAGFSRYADYPMGPGVVERLYSELSKAQRVELATMLRQEKPKCPDWPLPKFAQYFVDLHHGSRARLIEILDSIFSAEPTRIDVHEKLARLTFINHIVTTNYDPLFELVYRPSRIHVVEQASQIPQVGNKEVALYKIHGQPSNPHSVIITEDDYNGFFNNADDVVWTYLRGLMSTRTIVFIGYAVEDPNVLFIFDGLAKKLGKLMKPAYAVGPHMDRVREERLLRNNIHYIKATGEEFVNELWAYIQDTALSELPKEGLAAIAPVSQMLSNLGMNFSVKIDGSGPLINDIKRREGKTINKFHIISDSVDLKQSIHKLVNGQSAKPVKIVADEYNRIAHTVEGFRLPNSDGAVLWLTRAPGWDGVVDVRFSSGFLLIGVKIKIYGKPNGINIVALSNSSRLEIVMNNANKNSGSYDCDMHFNRRMRDFKDTLSAIECVDTMKVLSQGEQFEILKGGQEIWRSNARMKMNNPKKFAKNSSDMRYIILMLQRIEKEFHMLFQNFNLDGQLIEDLTTLHKLLNLEPILFVMNEPLILNGLDIYNPELGPVFTSKKPKPNSILSFETDTVNDFDIMGWKLRLLWTETIEVLQPIGEKIAGDDNYQVRSKNKRLLRRCTKIKDAKVISSPIVNKSSVDMQEEIEEAQPQF